MMILALAVILLLGVVTYVIRKQRRVCQVNQRIEELARRLGEISASPMTGAQRSVLITAQMHLQKARDHWQKDELALADQAISLAHLNAHSADSAADSHGLLHEEHQ